MANPTFKKIKPDDTFWLYRTSYADFVRITQRLEEWFAETIFHKDPDGKCNGITKHTLKYANDLGSDKEVELQGICGTPRIRAGGFELPAYQCLVRFHREFSEMPLNDEKFGDFDFRGFAEVALKTTTLESFVSPINGSLNPWDFFEPCLFLFGGRGTAIEYIVEEFSGHVYVHIDLGRNIFLRDTYMGLVKRFGKEYLQWLANPVAKMSQLVPRTVAYTDRNGKEFPIVKLSPASVITADDGIPPPDLDPATCKPGCIYASCNVDTGELASYDPETGVLKFDLKDIYLKAYCRKPGSTEPCP